MAVKTKKVKVQSVKKKRIVTKPKKTQAKREAEKTTERKRKSTAAPVRSAGQVKVRGIPYKLRKFENLGARPMPETFFTRQEKVSKNLFGTRSKSASTMQWTWKRIATAAQKQKQAAKPSKALCGRTIRSARTKFVATTKRTLLASTKTAKTNHSTNTNECLCNARVKTTCTGGNTRTPVAVLRT